MLAGCVRPGTQRRIGLHLERILVIGRGTRIRGFRGPSLGRTELIASQRPHLTARFELDAEPLAADGTNDRRCLPIGARLSFDLVTWLKVSRDGGGTI